MDQGNTAVIQSPSFIQEDMTAMRVNVSLDGKFFIAMMASEYTSNVLRLGIIYGSIAGVVPPNRLSVNT